MAEIIQSRYDNVFIWNYLWQLLLPMCTLMCKRGMHFDQYLRINWPSNGNSFNNSTRVAYAQRYAEQAHST